MAKARARGRSEEIREFILQHVEQHPGEVSKMVAKRFSISRQAVNKYLQRLVSEKALTEEGATRSTRYKLATILDWKKAYEIQADLEEHILWERDIAPALGPQPENVSDIWHYGFTEMLNNAKEHSGGTEILVTLTMTAISTEMTIADDGVGIFKKVQEAFHLPDERYAILELSKGKLTTDPKHHTGEGIFFGSRMFDSFRISSGGLSFGHELGNQEDVTLDSRKASGGTAVSMRLSNHTSRTLKKVFDQYTSREDFGFHKTVIPVRLAQYGHDKLVSRSQAKRVLSRVEAFAVAEMDFDGVPTIGQAFADEIFRVFAREHPEVELVPVRANSEVKRMIARAKSGGGSPPSLMPRV